MLGGANLRSLTEAVRRGSGTMIHGIYQMTPRQFRKAIEAGVFGENHVELLGGIPFIMSENPPHILASVNVSSGIVLPWHHSHDG